MIRGKAYLDAGGDCFFVPGIKETDELWSITKALSSPVNVIALPGIPDFKTLKEIGVARLSLGPGFLKTAVKAMKELALKLKNHEGLDEVLTNDVTSDYLKNLVNTH
jgi:2-methylisocitrate lyase-like PEP mutase family enzyme